MARKQAAKKETKSDFLRKVLSKNPDLDYQQVNRRWAKAGHADEISNPLYYKVRRELGIQTVWTWAPDPKLAARAPQAASRSTGEVYQFKITLMESRPPIWRRIQVGDCMLDTLHEHIQTSMGWTNSHMHQFRIGDRLHGDPMLISEMPDDMNYADSTTTLLSEIVPEDGKPFSFEYEYDFGDGWVHEILFEGRLPDSLKPKTPLCVEGERACPPEDVGGIWGYVDFLDAIANPEHAAHDEMREWLGRKFDPDAFSPRAATSRMKKGLPDWRAYR